MKLWKDEHGQFQIVEALLVSQILIGSHEHVETSGFGERQQFAVFLSLPSALKSALNFVSCQIRPQRFGHTLVEKNLQEDAEGTVRISAAASNCSRVMPSYHSRNCSNVPP